MEANGSKSGPVPPRNAETVAHPKPPVHPPVSPRPAGPSISASVVRSPTSEADLDVMDFMHACV